VDRISSSVPTVPIAPAAPRRFLRRVGTPFRLTILLVVVVAGWYLHDPPWAGDVTSGLRPWEEDPPGTHFRWTNGRASFFVPSLASEMTLQIRALFPSRDGRPVIVSVSVDDQRLFDVELRHPTDWELITTPLPRRGTSRRYRRVELRVNRVVGPFNLGVQLGEVVTK
jgi:hypothetical protein